MRITTSLHFFQQSVRATPPAAALASLAFLERKENVLLLGAPGVGKTHLGIALGTEAIVAGSSVYFVTMQDLVQQFSRARDENKLKERMVLLVKPKLLILDGMGYLTLDSFAATCLFRLVSERYEKGFIILTSNKSYGDWGSIFAVNVIASSILDRLLRHSTHHQHQGRELSAQGQEEGRPHRPKAPWQGRSRAKGIRAGACGSGLRPPPHPPATPEPASNWEKCKRCKLGNFQLTMTLLGKKSVSRS